MLSIQSYSVQQHLIILLCKPYERKLSNMYVQEMLYGYQMLQSTHDESHFHYMTTSKKRGPITQTLFSLTKCVCSLLRCSQASKVIGKIFHQPQKEQVNALELIEKFQIFAKQTTNVLQIATFAYARKFPAFQFHIRPAGSSSCVTPLLLLCNLHSFSTQICNVLLCYSLLPVPLFAFIPEKLLKF